MIGSKNRKIRKFAVWPENRLFNIGAKEDVVAEEFSAIKKKSSKLDTGGSCL
jgi:hypothetical protein